MKQHELEQALHQQSLQRSQAPTGRLKTATELRANEYSPCAAINAEKDMYQAQATLRSNPTNGTLVRQFAEAQRAAGSAKTMCRRCNDGITQCFNTMCTIQSQVEQERKGYDNKAKQERAVLERSAASASTKTLERVKPASELGSAETSPCEAINAQKRLERAQEAPSTVENMMHWRQAQDAFQSVASQCRKCNPYITSCYCGCDISSKAIAKQKGYSE